MLEGCIRHQDPTAAFNIIPAPMLDVVAGLTLINLYNPNCTWDFISGKLCLFEKKLCVCSVNWLIGEKLMEWLSLEENKLLLTLLKMEWEGLASIVPLKWAIML